MDVQIGQRVKLTNRITSMAKNASATHGIINGRCDCMTGGRFCGLYTISVYSGNTLISDCQNGYLGKHFNLEIKDLVGKKPHRLTRVFA